MTSVENSRIVDEMLSRLSVVTRFCHVGAVNVLHGC